MTRTLSTPGPRPFGRTAAERRCIRRILGLRARGDTWQEIADLLNAGGSPQRNGKPWHPSRVAGVHASHAPKS